MPENLIQLLIQAGPVAIVSAVFLWFGDKKDQRVNTVINNHLQHSTSALEKQAESNKQMAKAITKLSVTIDHLKK